MIQVQTYLRIIDNTGVKTILCIRILGTTNSVGKVGFIIIGAVKKSLPKSSIKKSDIVRVLVVRIHMPILRTNGTRVIFSDNAGILLTKDNSPIGTRIFGPIAREIRVMGFTKVFSIASDIF